MKRLFCPRCNDTRRVPVYPSWSGGGLTPPDDGRDYRKPIPGVFVTCPDCEPFHRRKLWPVRVSWWWRAR